MFLIQPLIERKTPKATAEKSQKPKQEELHHEIPEEIPTEEPSVSDILLDTKDTKQVPQVTIREQKSYTRITVDKIRSVLSLLSCCSASRSQEKVVLLSCLFMLFYSGTSIIYNQFMPSFLQTSLHVSSLQASYIHSALNYASTFSRGIGILVALKLPPQAMIIINLCLFNVGSLFLLAFSLLPCTMTRITRVEIVSYIGNIIIGLGMGSVSAPLLSFLKKHGEVSNVTGSVFVFCNGFTSVFVPLIVASVMTKSSSFLLVFNLINISFSLIIFIFVIMKVRYIKRSLVETMA